jgi:hypothetical protein
MTLAGAGSLGASIFSLLPLQQAAKALAVTAPPTLLATADEVIE